MSIWIVSLLSLTYAAVRYLVVGSVPISHAPAFVLNKAVSLAGILLLAGGALQRLRGIDASRSFEGAGWLITLHLLLTFPLMAAGSYPSLLESGGHLNAWGQGMVLAGALGALLLWRKERERFQAAALLLTAGHVLMLGLRGWLTPGKWHGGLPPITLLAFLAAGGAGVWCLLAKPSRSPLSQTSAAAEGA